MSAGKIGKYFVLPGLQKGVSVVLKVVESPKFPLVGKSLKKQKRR